MKKKIATIIGELLSVIGFTGIFAVADDFGLQLIWTSSAVAVLLIGQAILKKVNII